jgi:hypothetical protein
MAARPRGAGAAATGVLGLAESALTYGHPIGGIAGAVATAITNGLLQTYLGASVLVHRLRDAGEEPAVDRINEILARAWADEKTSPTFRSQIPAVQEELIGALLEHLKEGVTEEVVGSLLIVGGAIAATRRTWRGVKALEDIAL